MNLITFINTLLNNQAFKTFMIVFTAVLAGYTLQPIPQWAHNIFNNSNIFKLIVLVSIGLTALHPVDVQEVVLTIVMSVLILYLFALSRKYDSPSDK